MLLVSTSVRVINRVHRNSSDLWPLVPLGLVFVVGTSGLQDRLVGTSSSCDESDHGAARAVQRLFGAGGQADTGDSLVRILGHNDGVVSGCLCELAAVSYFGFDVADNSTFRDLANR